MSSKLSFPMYSIFSVFTLILMSGVASSGETERFYYYAEGAIVEDGETGLQWMRCAIGQEWNPATSSCDGDASQFAWGSALEVTSGLGGFANWRLPTREELSGLVLCSSGERESFKTSGLFTGNGGRCQGQYERPTIDQRAFPNTPYKDAYWTSERLENAPVHHAWVVGFGTGYVNDIAQSSPYPHVRLVREP